MSKVKRKGSSITSDHPFYRKGNILWNACVAMARDLSLGCMVEETEFLATEEEEIERDVVVCVQ
jgi:hypothetical protein